MKTLLAFLLLMSAALLQAQAKPYTVSFICRTEQNPECPFKKPCPVLPAGSRGCGIAPAGVGAEHVPPGVWPVGCVVSLPYKHPHYPTQKTCDCQETIDDRTKKAQRHWRCPL